MCLPVHVDLYVSSCTCWTLPIFLYVLDSTCLRVCVGLYVSSCTCWTIRVFLYVLDSTCLPVRVGLYVSSFTCWTLCVFLYVLDSITEKHGGSEGGWWAMRGGLEVDLMPLLDLREHWKAAEWTMCSLHWADIWGYIGPRSHLPGYIVAH